MNVNQILNTEITPNMTVTFLQDLELKVLHKMNTDKRISYDTFEKLYDKVSQIHHETFNPNRKFS